MKIAITNETGQNPGGEIEVSDAVFGVAFNEPLVHQVVVAYRANGRLGARKQKTRSEVRGGGRKPWRQKGTGQARAGTTRSPLWRGGGKTFPSTPDENFTQKVNRKMYRSALRTIFSELMRQGRLLAVEDFKVERPKTKEFAARLKGLGAEDALIVTESIDPNLGLASRNLHRVEVCTPNSADPVSLLRHERVIVTAGAMKHIETWLA